MKAVIDRDAGVFETMLMLGGRLLDQRDHMRRLAESVEAVYGSRLPAGLNGELDGLRPLRRARVRVSVWPAGRSLASRVEVEPQQPDPRTPALALIPVTTNGGLGCHKWRDRSWLNDQRRQYGCDTADELLLLDSDGEVLETERASLLIVEGGRLVATPDDARRLPSLTRRRAIAAAEDVGLVGTVQPISLERLLAADQVLAANSVRLVAAVAACGAARWPPTPIAERLTSTLGAR
jgi:branched-subunit amino acid aminotransferase/4-amino-4-deoxychorismate lyase